MKDLLQKLSRINKLKNRREFEKAIPLSAEVLEQLSGMQDNSLDSSMIKEALALTKSFIELADSCFYWQKILNSKDHISKKILVNYRFSGVLLKLLHTSDIGLVLEYSRAVKFLLSRESRGKELLIEGLLHEMLNVKNISLIVSSIRNPTFRYIIYNTTKSLPIDFPEAWSHSDGTPMLKALLSTRYRSSYDKEKTLINQNIKLILKKLYRGCNELDYVDWGPGDGVKTASIVEAASNQFGKVNVCLVDCSKDMIGASEKNIRKVSAGNVKIIKACTSFDRLFENQEYKNLGNNKFHSFLGTTFCNFDPNLICRILKSSLGKGDHALIGVHLYDETHDSRILEAYCSKEMIDVSYQGLRDIGFGKFDPSELKYNSLLIKSNEPELGKLTKLITYFEVKKPMKRGLLAYNKGDQIPAILSIKYTEEQFKKIIGNYFTILDMFKEDDVGLFLVKNA